MGWHADDEQLFQGRFIDARVLSISFGAERKFELRTNWPDEEETKDGRGGVKRVTLRNGDLMTMEGMMQKHFQQIGRAHV